MSADASARGVEDLRALLTPAVLARAVAPPRAVEAQRAWELLIAGYLYLGGLGAGAFIAATCAGWAGLGLDPSFVSFGGGWVWDWSPLFVLWGPFATALGAALLVFHLGRNWWRFWSAGFNPRTSWMARGFSILLAFIVLGSAVACVSVFLPDWPDRLPALWRALEAAALVAAFGTAVYTGVLLRSMRFIPAWRQAVLPWLFLASALSTGSMGVVLGALASRAVSGEAAASGELVRGLESVEPFVLVAEGVLLGVYLRRLRGAPAGLLSARLLLRGRWRVGFWAGVVGLALSLPFVLVLTNAAAESTAVSVVAALSVLTGGFVLRCAVLAAGVTEAPPLYRLARWRAARPVATAGGAVPAEAAE